MSKKPKFTGLTSCGCAKVGKGMDGYYGKKCICHYSGSEKLAKVLTVRIVERDLPKKMDD